MSQLFQSPIVRYFFVPSTVCLGIALSSSVLADEKVASAKEKPAVAVKLPALDSVSGLNKLIAKAKAEEKARERTREKKGNKERERDREEEREREARRHKKSSSVARKEEENERVEWLEARKFYIKQRAYPNDKVDWQAIQQAVISRDQMPKAVLRPISSTPRAKGGAGQPNNPSNPGTPISAKSLSINAASTAAVPRWEFLGPKSLQVPYRIYYGQGSTSGRVNAIAYTSPPASGPDTTAGTVYAAAAGGGVWKSTNTGITWTALSDGWPSLNVSSIAVDPKNPNNVYVGTGDYQGYVGYQFGIMKSTDGGANWTNTGFTEFGTVAVSHVAVDPDSSNIVTVTTGNGLDGIGYVWRSTDSGASWTKAFGSLNSWSGLAISAADNAGNRSYYASGFGEIWRSDDRGATWQSLSLPANASLSLYSDVATSKTNAKTVYLLSPGDEKLYNSKDAGATWTDITGAFPGGYNWSQGFYDFHITTSTLTDRFNNVQDVVYAGLIDIDQSPNSGTTWRSIGQTYTDSALTHNDQHSMAINPRNPNDMMVGNDGGLYRLTFDPRADRWQFDTRPNNTLGITQFYHAAFHPYIANKMLGGTQDNATPISFGDLSKWQNVAGGDGGFAEIHPLSPNIQYATVYGLQLYQTLNEWKSSSVLFGPFGPSAFLAPIAIDPQDPQVVYEGTDTVWRYSSKTRIWTQLGPPQSNGGILMFIAVSPTDSKRIYTGSDLGEVFMTKNGGQTWTEIDQGNTSLPNRTITSIAVHPDNPSRVVVTVSGTGSSHVWRCDDTTAPAVTWTDASGGLPDVPSNTVALDQTDPTNTYYVGTDVGVFVTQNGGSSWSNMTQSLGLPNVQVNELRTVYGTGYLNAATYGRGMWRIQVANPVAPVIGVTTIPTTLHGGFSATVVITLLSPAPSGGQDVTLSSSNPALVTVPSTVAVVAGYNIRQVPITTKPVTKKTVVTITATAGGKTRTTNLTLTP